jgi:hypothetical protein
MAPTETKILGAGGKMVREDLHVPWLKKLTCVLGHDGERGHALWV